MAQVLALPKAHGRLVRKPHQKHLSKGKYSVSDPIFRLKCEIILLTFLDKTIFRQVWGGVGVPLLAENIRWIVLDYFPQFSSD